MLNPMTNEQESLLHFRNSRDSDNAKQRRGGMCESLAELATSELFWLVGIAWLLLVVVSGAGYVLVLGGICVWSTQNCDATIEINNQVITALFTAINLYAMPSRTIRALSLFGADGGPPDAPRNLLHESYDPTTFYHLPWSSRAWIASLLFVSALSQFVNQAFHAVYRSYGASMTLPGAVWDNAFFFASLLTMLVGLGVESWEESRLRAAANVSFPPTASTALAARVRAAFAKSE
jgi:hypothetical protein